jgi:hypothetical protein
MVDAHRLKMTQTLDLRPTGLTFEHHLPSPGSAATVGIGESQPRLSWQWVKSPEDLQ